MEKERRIKTLAIVSVIVAILGLTISFAALSKTLKISSNAMVSPVNWQLKFSNLSDANITGNAILNEEAKIDTDKPVTISGINVSFKTPGDKVIYKVDLVNEGTIDAQIDEVISTISSSLIDFTVNYTDSKNTVSKGDIIKSGEVKNLTLTLYYNKENITKETLPNEDINISLSYGLVFTQTDSKTTTSKAQTLNCTAFTKKDTYSVGDVISFCNENTGKSEDFYVIEDNGDTVSALAKYNLMVGKKITYTSNMNSISSIEDLDSSAENYGLQSDKAYCIAIDDNGFTACLKSNDGLPVLAGAMEFSGESYWSDDDGNILSKYGTSFPAKVLDENSSLKAPLDNYVNYLKTTIGKKSITGSLISYEQLEKIGCPEGSCEDDNTISWVYNTITSFWTASARSSSEIWIMDVSSQSSTYDNMRALKPVITINKSEI